jgi:hypothetical protein
MAFSSYKTLASVAEAWDLNIQEKAFMRISTPTIAPHFREHIDFMLRERLYEPSEAARCETLVFPLLQETWRSYHNILKLWSHVGIEYSAELSGTPDYLIARQSERGKAILGQPIMVAIEAKQDDFASGWAQCAAEMVAIQKLNHAIPHLTIFGAVTNGTVWEFAMLQGSMMTREIVAFGIGDLDKLFGALSYIMEECAKQVTTPHLENN